MTRSVRARVTLLSILVVAARLAMSRGATAVGNTPTIEQFLAWEEAQGLRYEFDGVQPIAMTGGTAAHSAINATLPSPWAAGRAVRRANSTAAT